MFPSLGQLLELVEVVGVEAVLLQEVDNIDVDSPALALLWITHPLLEQELGDLQEAVHFASCWPCHHHLSLHVCWLCVCVCVCVLVVHVHVCWLCVCVCWLCACHMQ